MTLDPLSTHQRTVWQILTPIAVACAVLSAACVPLFSKIQIGGDEGYELLKAALVSEGAKLYVDVWNDQPPLCTWILGGLFAVFGEETIVARLLAVCWSSILIGSFYQLVSRASGWLAGISASLFLVTAPFVTELLFSSMLAVPPLAMVLLACAILQTDDSAASRGKFALAGALIGLAFQMKLTACLMLPFLVASIASNPAWGSPSTRRTLIRSIWLLVGLATFSFVLISWLSPGLFRFVFQSHFSAAVRAAAEGGHQLSVRDVLFYGFPVIEALVALGLIVVSVRLREVAAPLLALVFVAAIHVSYRPWWDYYYVHLAIPVAYLAGIGFSRSLGWLCSSCRKGQRRWWKIFPAAAVSLISLVVLVKTSFTGIVEFQRLCSLPATGTDGLLRAMAAFREQTTQIYSRDPIYPFHARLPVLPSLAILPAKRFWSGHVTEAQILNALTAARPEQVVLSCTAEFDPAWTTFLEKDYDRAYADEAHFLFVRRDVRRLACERSRPGVSLVGPSF